MAWFEKSDKEQLIDPAKPVPEVVAQAGQVEIKSDGSKLTAETVPPPPVLPERPLASSFVRVEENPGGKLWALFRGVCTKCGFQSHKPTAAEAQQMVEIHAQRHTWGQ